MDGTGIDFGQCPASSSHSWGQIECHTWYSRGAKLWAFPWSHTTQMPLWAQWDFAEISFNLGCFGCKTNFWSLWCHQSVRILDKNDVFQWFSWSHQLMISPWPSHGVFVWGKRPVPWSRAGSAWPGSSAAKSCHWSRRGNGKREGGRFAGFWDRSWTENDLSKRSMWKFHVLNVEEKTRAFSNSRDFRVQWFVRKIATGDLTTSKNNSEVKTSNQLH